MSAVHVAGHLSVDEIRMRMQMSAGFLKFQKWLVIYNVLIDPGPSRKSRCTRDSRNPASTGSSRNTTTAAPIRSSHQENGPASLVGAGKDPLDVVSREAVPVILVSKSANDPHVPLGISYRYRRKPHAVEGVVLDHRVVGHVEENQPEPISSVRERIVSDHVPGKAGDPPAVGVGIFTRPPAPATSGL